MSDGPIPGGGWTQAELDAVEKVRLRHRRLRKLDLDRVDLVTAGANQGALVALMKSASMIPVQKVDADRYRVYGFASVSTVKGQELVDAHGDVIGAADLEEAAATFRGAAGLNHQGEAIGEVFESVYVDAEKAKAMGLEGADGFAGWWIGVQLPPGPVWESVKAGKLPAFSIQGKAIAEPIGKSSSHQEPAVPSEPIPVPSEPNPERVAFLKQRAEAIRRDGGRHYVPEAAHVVQQRDVELAKAKLAKLSEEIRSLER